MPDPISMAAGGAALGFVNAFGARLAQRLIPTRFELSQIESVELQRKRIAAEEDRFRIQLEDARQRLLAEHQHRRDEIIYKAQLDRWKLPFTPHDFIIRSSGAGRSSLNILLTTSDHRAASKPDQDPTHGALLNASLKAGDFIASLYSDRTLTADPNASPNVILYRDATLRPHSDIQMLVTGLSSLLSTEPTVLMDVGMCGPHHYRVALAHWALAPGLPPQPEVMPVFYLDLSSDARGATDTEASLMLALASILTSLADSFFILRIPHERPKPTLPVLMHRSAQRKTSWAWAPITNVYQGALAHVSRQAPALAAELAANASSQAFAFGQVDYSETLLDFAVDQLKPASDGVRSYTAVMKDGGTPRAVREALVQVKGLPDVSPDAPGPHDIQKIARRMRGDIAAENQA